MALLAGVDKRLYFVRIRAYSRSQYQMSENGDKAREGWYER